MDLEQLISRMTTGQTVPNESLQDVATPSMELPGAGGRAANIIRARKKYGDYVFEMQSAGETPLPFDAWIQEQMGASATVNPYQPR